MGQTQDQETQDIVDAVLEDHERFQRLFADFQQATAGQRSEVWQALVRGLAVHETAEEEIVHPQVRRLVDGGDDIVEKRLVEEDQAKKELATSKSSDRTRRSSNREFVSSWRRCSHTPRRKSARSCPRCGRPRTTMPDG